MPGVSRVLKYLFEAFFYSKVVELLEECQCQISNFVRREDLQVKETNLVKRGGTKMEPFTTIFRTEN